MNPYVQSFNVQFNSNGTTVNGGKGDDLIDLDYRDGYGETPTGIVVEYSEGDGNDTVVGFNETSILKIGGGNGSYSKEIIGNDIIVTVGDGAITLVGAASLSAVNIDGKKEVSEHVLTIEDTQAIYSKGDEILFTIYGINPAATVEDFDINDKTVTLSKYALGTEDIFIEGEGYNLALATDVITSPMITAEKWSPLTNGTATYTAKAYSGYYTFADNTINYTEAKGGETFTISGIKSRTANNVVVNDKEKIVTLFPTALGTDNVTLESDDYSLQLDDTVTQNPGDAEHKFTAFTNGTATFKIFGDNAYYTLEGNDVYYTAATADKQFTISGLANNLTLENGELEGVAPVIENGNLKFVLSEDALKNSDVTLSGTNCTLELDEGVTQAAEDIAAAWSEVVNGTASYSINGKTKYYTLNNGKVVYHAPTAGELLLTVEGLSANATTEDGAIDGLEVDEDSLTISASAVGKNVALKYNKNDLAVYLDEDVENISFTGTSKADSIVNEGTNISIDGGEGNDLITDNAASNVTINTASGNDTIKLGTTANSFTAQGFGTGDVIELASPTSNLVTISGGDYKLKLASDVDTIAEDNTGWTTLTGGNVAYLEGGTGSYYSLSGDGKSVTYNASVAGSNKVELGGVKGTPTISGKTVSLTANNFNGNVSVKSNAGGYAFNLSGALGGKKFTGTNKADSIVNEGTNISIDGGEGNDLITDNAASNVTINTASGNDTIKLGASVKAFTAQGFGTGDVIELASPANNLVTISGGIKAGNVSIGGVNSIATINNSWTTSTNSIVYKQSTIAGAKLDGTKITYDSTSGSNNLFTISGLSSTVGVSLSGKNVVLSSAALKTGTVSISGGDYKLKLANDVDTVKENISAWTTLTGGNVAYLEGGTGSYYSLSGDGKSVIYNASVAGSNKVELGGVKGTPTISGKTVSLTANNFNSNVSVKSNTGGYNFALSGAFGGKKFTGTSSADSITNAGTNISIDGGAGNDSITSGGSNVTIIGGNGNDVFVYSKGTATIADYTAGTDKISLNTAQISDVALNSKDIVLGLGKNDSLTIAKGKDKKITLTDSKAVQYIFGDHVIFNSGKTAATLTSAATNFSSKAYSSLTSIDATKTAQAAQIVGNDKANKIFAGAKGSTLNGGKGNDTLVGGNGTDIFVYENKTGNDVIQNYTSGKDKISLGAGASIASFSVNKTGDAVLKVGSNNITLKKVGDENISSNGKKITVIDANGNETTQTYYTNRTATSKGVTLNSAFDSKTFTADSKVITVDASQVTNAVVINGNAKNNVLTGGTGNDKIIGGKGNDSLYGNAGKDSISGDAGDDKIFGGAGNDTLLGGDGNDSILGEDDNDKISGGKGKDTLRGGNGNDSLSGDDSDDKLYGDDGNDTLKGGAGKDILSGGDGDDKLYGETGNDKLTGGNGNDSLWGGAGNDTFTGGDGADVFIYESGKDVITDYAKGDRISIGGAISKSATKSSSVLLTVGTNTLTIKKAKGKQLNLTDSSGNEIVTIIGGLKYTNSTKASVTISSYAEYASASTRTKAIKITGNALDNTIIGGKGNDSLIGGKGDDSLWGGKGNDTLFGGDGSDTFIYKSGEGNDVISGFEDNDLLQITGTFTSSYNKSNKEVSFNVDSTANALTLKNFTATTFNINGTNYKISGTSLVKK